MAFKVINIVLTYLNEQPRVLLKAPMYEFVSIKQSYFTRWYKKSRILKRIRIV